MARVLKIIIINIFLLCLVLIVTEALLFYSYKKYNPNTKYIIKHIKYKEILKDIREPEGLDYNKRPIILTGCSFIYGLFLEGEHTPHYKLSKLTQRPVFNWALTGKGLQHSLYIIKNKLYDDRMHNPEYFIYVMIFDHIRRMYSSSTEDDIIGQPGFKIDRNGKITLKYEDYPLYKKFFTYYYINNLIYSKYYINRLDLRKKDLFVYYREMYKLLKQQFPDIKFVILLYNEIGINFDELEKEGFIVLNAKELTGINFSDVKYCVSAKDPHPNETAWDILIPALAKKLNL